MKIELESNCEQVLKGLRTLGDAVTEAKGRALARLEESAKQAAQSHIARHGYGGGPLWRSIAIRARSGHNKSVGVVEAGYPDTPTGKYYAFAVEYGVRQRNGKPFKHPQPARPFMAPARQKVKKQVKTAVTEELGKVLQGWNDG